MNCSVHRCFDKYGKTIKKPPRFADSIDISWPTANALDGMSCVGEMTVHRVDIHAHGIFIYGFEKIGERVIAMEWFARTVSVSEKDNHVQSV